MDENEDLRSQLDDIQGVLEEDDDGPQSRRASLRRRLATARPSAQTWLSRDLLEGSERPHTTEGQAKKQTAKDAKSAKSFKPLMEVFDRRSEF